MLRCENPNCLCHREGRNVHCPAHDDKISCLSVNDAPGAESKSGAKSLWHYHGGCPQENVTKALHKLVFEGPDPTNGDTSTSGDAAKTAASKTSRTLRQRGIGAETRRYFRIESYPGIGLRYPVLDANGAESYQRIKSAVPDQPKYSDYKPREVASLAIYNKAIAADSVRMKRGLYLVKSEFEVWTMYQCGLAAVCFLGAAQNFDVLIPWLMQQQTYSITTLFGHDVAGRQSALGLFDATREKNVEVKIGLLDGPLGFDLSDLFCRVDFNPRRFRDEIDQLDFASFPVREAWRENPEVGLPDAAPEGATEGTNEEGAAKIGADGLFECLGEAGLDALPLPGCVVEGLVLEGRPTIFFGQFGTGKSFIALDMAICISQNMDWCGRQIKPGMPCSSCAFFAFGVSILTLKTQGFGRDDCYSSDAARSCASTTFMRTRQTLSLSSSHFGISPSGKWATMSVAAHYGA